MSVELRQAYQSMITAIKGGWITMCSNLGMTRSALENHVYEKKGQTMSVDMAMLIQDFSGTTIFAETVARLSGGTFVKLPDIGGVSNESLFSKFNELHAELGMLSSKFSEFTDDDELDDDECAKLTAIKGQIHRKMEELMALTFLVYRKDAGRD